MSKNKDRQLGFTLIELLVVIAIVGLMASILFSTFHSAQVSARDAKRKQDMHIIVNAINLYASDHGGAYPSAQDNDFLGDPVTNAGNLGFDLSALGNGFLPELVSGGYMARTLLDPINQGNIWSYWYVAKPSNAPSTGNNKVIRTSACIDSNQGEAQAALLFPLEKGYDSSYLHYNNTTGTSPWNVICFY